MTSKQRSNLKSIAATLKPIAQVGKEGVSDNLLKSLSDALEAHELIKLNLLPLRARMRTRSQPRSRRRSMPRSSSSSAAAPSLYRRSSREGFDHIKF